MGYFDSFQDFTPLGLLGNIYSSATGNKSPVDSMWNAVKGDPEGIKNAYDQAMGKSQQMGEQTRDFLLGQQQKALGFYAPIQQMFNNAYGSQGIAGPQHPGVPGSSPIGTMLGRR